MRLQLTEHDRSFEAVERTDANGFVRIFRHGQEKMIWVSSFPPHLQDLDMEALALEDFQQPLWRHRDAAVGAGVNSWAKLLAWAIIHTCCSSAFTCALLLPISLAIV